MRPFYAASLCGANIAVLFFLSEARFLFFTQRRKDFEDGNFLIEITASHKCQPENLSSLSPKL